MREFKFNLRGKEIHYELPDDIDDYVVPMVIYFNLIGLPTVMSCEGHDNTYMSMFWIEFDQSVTEEDIVNFQMMHLAQPNGAFVSCGWFAERMYVCTGFDGQKEVKRAWRYMAATKLAAMTDITEWLNEDLERSKDYDEES